MGLPGDGDRLELTYNSGVDAYELGTAYGHVAVTVDDMHATLERLAEQGSEPERPPYTVREGGPLLCFVRDPIVRRCVSEGRRRHCPSLPDRRLFFGCPRRRLASTPSVLGLQTSRVLRLDGPLDCLGDLFKLGAHLPLDYELLQEPPERPDPRQVSILHGLSVDRSAVGGLQNLDRVISMST
jgi:catechol 2,3-dioxygenase-like lactoylglutathione lyase family enzyme